MSLRRLHLLYHELRPAQSGYSYVIDTESFGRHMDLLTSMRSDATSGLWPDLTFDDGHLSDIEHAFPILQSRGITAQFFITVGWTGHKSGYMDWRDLRVLHESGHLIGAHGWSHTLLTHCTKKDLDWELTRSRLLLEDKLGTSITTMSLPGGRFDRRVLAACKEAGYSRVFTSEPKAENVTSGFTVGRLNIRGDMKLDWIRDLLQPGSSALASLERRSRVKFAAQRLLGDRLYDKLWSVLNGRELQAAEGGRSAR
ncbi:MAG: polysaccharide deacetylase family protein [Acidobacteriota bacterium]|nr:polysaccharide deacetylase family protein [Acidobacteriota bacterium]